MKKLFFLLIVLTNISHVVLGQVVRPGRGGDPYPAPELSQGLSVSQIRNIIVSRLEQSDCSRAVGGNAYSFAGTAELMKRVGDYRAVICYEAAITADPVEPAYELFYADYLRIFRGAQKPLFSGAERHYTEAVRKLSALRTNGMWNGAAPNGWDDDTEIRVERGRVALYQEDGVPFSYRSPIPGFRVPVTAFSTVNAYADLSTDLDQVDDTRSYLSEVFTSQREMGQTLTQDRLRSVIRSKRQRVTFDRVRIRTGSGPVLDALFEYRDGQESQTTSFREPGIFNDIRVKNAGLGVEKSFSISNALDVYLRGTYKRVYRNGLIEHEPDKGENIDQFQAKAAIARFFGPDKLTIEGTFVRQNIEQQIDKPIRRDRNIESATVDYGLFRPLTFIQEVYGQRFETRGLHFFAGFARDRETYADVRVRKVDYFGGASLRGLWRFDFTFQPTVFRAEADSNPAWKHTEYRTGGNILFRIVDEESGANRMPRSFMGVRTAFVHLIVPFKHDQIRTGIKELENYSVAAELAGKFFVTGAARTTFLLSIKGGTQRFHKLDKNIPVFLASVSVGY